MTNQAQQTSPVEGSIQWAMNRGHLYRIDGGGFKYGQLITYTDSPEAAAQASLYRDERYSTWLPNGTILTVWNVYDGTIGGFCLKDPIKFLVYNGNVEVCA